MNWEAFKAAIQEQGDVPHENWYILGIDLGTTNSVISYWCNSGQKPESIDISNGFGKIPLPSVVQFRKGDGGNPDEWVIGEEAYRSMKIYPETTIRSIKRKMGTNETIRLGGTDYLPEEISAKILRELVDHVHALNPNAEIAGLCVSVPYDFDDSAKKATRRAVALAGLEDKLICLIEEPKAAALAYNFRSQLTLGEKILVFDFGGGTLDITLFQVSEKDDERIKLQVISEGGEAYHGGDNIDEAILEKCYELIRTKTGSCELAPENQAELIARAREVKERLSGVKNFRIPFTFCIPPFVEQLTREQFEELNRNFISKTRKLVLKALRECYIGPVSADSIDRVLLEGGSSQMPWVKEMLTDIFGSEDKIYTSEKPALDISIGATYYAAMKMGVLGSPDVESERMGPKVEFEVTAPHDIGLEVESGGKKMFFTMIRRGTPYALAKKSHIFTLSGDNPADMTTFELKILERINKEDPIEACKLIGEVVINGLPSRPSGKTKLRITLTAQEEAGLVRGSVEDLGFAGEFEPSGFKEDFDPGRFAKVEL